MQFRSALALALFAIAGCGVPTPFHGDVTFTVEERAEIERGAAFLSAHTSGEEISIVWDAPHKESGCDPGTIARSQGVGAATIAGNCIVIGIEPNPLMNTAAVAAHEFGHWYGLRHSSRGLMQPWNIATLEWTEEDEASCVAAGRC